MSLGNNPREEYAAYVKMIAEQVKNSPSRGELEKIKQDNNEFKDGGGFGDVMFKYKQREIKHKIEQDKKSGRGSNSFERTDFDRSLNDRLNNSVVPTINITRVQNAVNQPAAPPSNFQNYNNMAVNPVPPTGWQNATNYNYQAPGYTSFVPQYPVQQPMMGNGFGMNMAGMGYNNAPPMQTGPMLFGTPPAEPNIGSIPFSPILASPDDTLERETKPILVISNAKTIDGKPSNMFTEVSELENRLNRDKQSEFRLELQRQMLDKERQKHDEKRRLEEEELRLEQKLIRDREEMAARELRENFERQQKILDLQKANEQIHNDSLIRIEKNKLSKFRTPQTTSYKAHHLGDEDYSYIEETLVRNAHNELRNDFTLSLERMRQEFGVTNKKMEDQIHKLMKATDREREEK